MATKVTFLENSGFIVETEKEIIVFDDYKDPAHAVVKAVEHNPEKPVVFFVTHNHPDHFNPDIFNLAQSSKRIYVLSNDIPSREVRDSMPVDWMSAGDIIEGIFDDIKVKAYGSTDAGVSYLVTLGDGMTIFHAGDLNYWHWENESTGREVEKAHNEYKTILGRIASENKRFDIAFFPVDVRMGANCAAGAEEFLEAIDVKNFFPMHFKGSYEEACDFENYRLPESVAERTAMHCLHKPGEHVTL